MDARQSVADERGSTTIHILDDDSDIHGRSVSHNSPSLRNYSESHAVPASSSSAPSSMVDISIGTSAPKTDTNTGDLFEGDGSAGHTIAARFLLSQEEMEVINNGDDLVSLLRSREALIKKKKVLDACLEAYKEQLDSASKSIDNLTFAQKYIRFQRSKTRKNTNERILTLSKQMLSIKLAISDLRSYIKKASDRIFIFSRDASLNTRRGIVYAAVCKYLGSGHPRITSELSTAERLSRFDDRDSFAEVTTLMLKEKASDFDEIAVEPAPVSDESITNAAKRLEELQTARREKLIALKPLMDAVPRPARYWDVFSEANKLNVSLIEQAQVCYEMDLLLSDEPGISNASILDSDYASKIFKFAGIHGWEVTEAEIRKAYKDHEASLRTSTDSSPKKFMLGSVKSLFFKNPAPQQDIQNRSDSADELNYLIFGDESGTEIVDPNFGLSADDVSLIETGVEIAQLVSLRSSILNKSNALDAHLESFRNRLELECKKFDELPFAEKYLPFAKSETGSHAQELVLRLSKQLQSIKKVKSKLRSYSKRATNRIFILGRNASLRQRRYEVHIAVSTVLGASDQRLRGVSLAQQTSVPTLSEESIKDIEKFAATLGGSTFRRAPVSDESITNAAKRLEELQTARREKLIALKPLMDAVPRPARYWDVFSEANKLNVSLIEQAQVCYEMDKLLSQDPNTAVSLDNGASDADYASYVFKCAGVSGWVVSETEIQEVIRIEEDTKEKKRPRVLNLIDYLKSGRRGIEDQLDQLNDENASLREELLNHFKLIDKVTVTQRLLDMTNLPDSKTPDVNERILRASSLLKTNVEKADILRKLLDDYDDILTKANVWKVATLANAKQTNEILDSDLKVILNSDENTVSASVKAISEVQTGDSLDIENFELVISEFRLCSTLLNTAKVDVVEAAPPKSGDAAGSMDELLESSTALDGAEHRYQIALKNVKQLPLKLILRLNSHLVESKLRSLQTKRQGLIHALVDKMHRRLLEDAKVAKKSCISVNDCTQQLLDFAVTAIEISIRLSSASEIHAEINNLEACTDTDFAIRALEKAGVPYHKLRPNVVRAMAAEVVDAGRNSSGSTK